MIVPLAALLLQSVTPSATSNPEPKVVRVWLDANVLTRGAPVRVYVQAAEDGNLVVLHRRTDGRMEVLFPNTPAADPSVRAGTYEIRGPNDRPGWVVREPDGTGMVLAALSPDPVRVDEFAGEAAWNPDALVPTWSGTDGEGAMGDVVQRMLGDGYFHYDLVTYTVAPPIYAQQYLPPGDSTPTEASNRPDPLHAPCLDCTFVGMQVIIVEPFTFCDGLRFACLGGRSFAMQREPCAALSPCGTPPQSALALALGPLPPPQLATLSPGPGPGITPPRGMSGSAPVVPRPRAPVIPVRSRAPSPPRAGTLVSNASQPRSPDTRNTARLGTSVAPSARVALAGATAPLSHVRYTRLSEPTPASLVVAPVQNGTARASAAAEGGSVGQPATFAAPGAPGAFGRAVSRGGGGASGGPGGQGGQRGPARQAVSDRLGESKTTALAASQPSGLGRALAATGASSAGGTRGVALPPATSSSAGGHVAPARPGVPVRRR